MVNLKSKLKQAQKQRGALLVMNLVIIALCLILFWGTIHMFRQLNDAFSRPAKTNWMENNVQSENYAYLVVNYHEDMVYGGLLSGTKKECYGVARYFEAAGRMRATMVSMIAGFVTNIVLDPLLIFGIGPFPRMEIAGAALATGIGQVITLLVYIIYYVLDPLPVKLRRTYLRPEGEICGKTYGIGIPATLNMALPSLLISALNGILAAYSGAYVLVLGVYYKLQTFIYLPSNGIIQGIRPLIGYNYGAGERKRVEQIYRLTLELTAGIMAIGTALCWLIPGGLIGLFTENPETVTIGITALHIISLGFILSAVSVTSSGALEALGQGMASLVISVMRYVAVIIPAAFVLSRLIGVTGVWWAFVCTESVTAVVAYVLYHRVWKRA